MATSRSIIKVQTRVKGENRYREPSEPAELEETATGSVFGGAVGSVPKVYTRRSPSRLAKAMRARCFSEPSICQELPCLIKRISFRLRHQSLSSRGRGIHMLEFRRSCARRARRGRYRVGARSCSE